MAKAGRNTARITVEAGDSDNNGETVDGEVLTDAQREAEHLEQDSADEILRRLSQVEAAEEVSWQVSRTAPAQDAGYLFDLTTPELTLANIKIRAGAGKYKVKGFRPNGRYVKTVSFTIAKEAERALTAPPQSFDYMAFIERQKMGNKEDLKFWAGLLIPALAPALMAMVTAMMTRKDSSIVELVTALKGLQGLQPDNSTAGKLHEVKTLIEMVKDIAPESDRTGSTWPDIVRDGLQAAAPIIQGLAARSAAAKAAAQGGVNMQPQSEQQQQPPQAQGDPMLQLLNWLQAQLPMLIQKAQQNKDPELYAELLADNIPPTVGPEVIKQWLGRADWWTLFKSLDARMAPYEAWFTRVRNWLIEMADEAIQGQQQQQEQPNPGD